MPQTRNHRLPPVGVPHRPEAQATPLTPVAPIEGADTTRYLLIAGSILALLPIASFLGQYAMSRTAGTTMYLFQHVTVIGVDWTLVPFNFAAVRAIDWKQGGSLYLIMCVSVAVNILAHAFWQYNGLDLGHMITGAGVVLPAGWLHLAFSIVEMVLFCAFVFCRKPGTENWGIATTFAALYFLAMGMSGYLMHGRLIVTDAIVSCSGLFFVLAYQPCRERLCGMLRPFPTPRS